MILILRLHNTYCANQKKQGDTEGIDRATPLNIYIYPHTKFPEKMKIVAKIPQQ